MNGGDRSLGPDLHPSTVVVSPLTADRFERGETLTEGTVID